ncbi:MAG: hypothetical protein K8J08_00095, partial [Thermoanaerobaculia bacterium]|nr:hypothetical protein [Thermoanaerobaculia bacterium]
MRCLEWSLAAVLLLVLVPGQALAGVQDTSSGVEDQTGAENREEDTGEPAAMDKGSVHDSTEEFSGPHGDGHDGSRLSDEAIPLQLEGFPQRPKPPIELGNHFLGTGTLWPGFELPTGAVWQPALIAFGSWRNAIQSLDNGTETRTEFRTRMDLFLNLQLSGSERLVVGIRPFDDDGNFTRYVFEGSEDSGFYDELDAGIETLFF